MANEIAARWHDSGDTLYAQVLTAVGTIYNGSTFETPADANWGDYDIAMTESGTTQIYRATFPAVAAGLYTILIYLQAGASPAVGDTLIGLGDMQWDGAAAGVTLSATQPAITWGQQKIAANVADEGALHITNSHNDGTGVHAQGGSYGAHNLGSYAGQYNEADAANAAGQRNESSGTNGSGQYNYASATGGSGQNNYGAGNGLTIGTMGGDPVDPMWATPGGDGDTLASLSAQLDELPTNEDLATALEAALAAYDAATVDGAITRAEFERILLAFTGGDTTGGATDEPAFLAQDGETERITTTMVNGDRTNTVLNGA